MTRFHRRLLTALLISAVLLGFNILAVVNGAGSLTHLVLRPFH